MALADEADALLAHGGPSSASQARLHLIRAHEKWLLSNLDAAQALVRTALQAFEAAGDAAGCSDAHALAARIAHSRGTSSVRDMEMEAAAARARDCGDALRLAAAEAALAEWAVFCDCGAAKTRWQPRLDALMAASHPAIRGWAHGVYGNMAFAAGDFTEAITHHIHAYEAALATGQIRQAILSAVNVGSAHANSNDHGSAVRWKQRGLDLARSTGWPESVAMCLQQMAYSLLPMGQRAMAHRLHREAIDLMSNSVGARSHAIALQLRGELEMDDGHLADALQTFRQLGEWANAYQQTDLQIESRRAQAEVLLAMRRPEDALAMASAAWALASTHNHPKLQVIVLTLMADIHARHALPTPDGMTAASAALHYLDKALKVSSEMKNATVPADLLEALARERARQQRRGPSAASRRKGLRLPVPVLGKPAAHP